MNKVTKLTKVTGGEVSVSPANLHKVTKVTGGGGSLRMAVSPTDKGMARDQK